MQRFAKLKKKNLSSGYRSTLIFQKFKLVLKPLNRNFFNFAKNCILTFGSLSNNKKKWGHALVFELYALKGKIEGFFNRLNVAMVTNCVLKMATTFSAMIGHLFYVIIVAATDNDL